jgi:hypothetical protein
VHDRAPDGLWKTAAAAVLAGPLIDEPGPDHEAGPAELDAWARTLRWEYGFRGAAAFVRAHRLDHVFGALCEVDRALAGGNEVRNPAGMIRWLVAEAERAEAHRGQGAGEPAAPRPLRPHLRLVVGGAAAAPPRRRGWP